MERRRWLAGAGSLLGAAASGAPLSAGPAALASKAEFPLARTRTYLNNAGFHPLSLAAEKAARDYLTRRTEGAQEPDWDVTHRVKAAFAQLIGAKVASIGYVNSTMVGENLVVAGLGLPGRGGNVVTDALHFEGSLYLYESLRARGLEVRVVKPREWRIEPADLERAVDKNTRLVAVSLVSYLNGFQHDLKTVCALAHAHGAHVYADIIQAAGALPIDVQASGVDFCACATYKWLMGDFGLGFLYVREDLLGRALPRVQHGWRQIEGFEYHLLPHDAPGPYPASWRVKDGASGHIEVGTFSRTAEACLGVSLPRLVEFGVANIQAHVQSLTKRLLTEMPRLGYSLLTPPESRSPIVSFVVKDPEVTAARLARARVEVKLAQHYMRVSPSIYNDARDVDVLLEALS